MSTKNAKVLALIAFSSPMVGVLVWAWLASSLTLATLILWTVLVVVVSLAFAVFGWRHGQKTFGADVEAEVRIKRLETVRTIMMVWLLVLPLYLVGLFLIEAPVILYVAGVVMFVAGLRGVMVLRKISRRMSANAEE